MSNHSTRLFYAMTLSMTSLLIGCSHREASAPAARPDPLVTIVHPERRTIETSVGQPAFIAAYEQTSIYPKIPGYVLKWSVDIGDRVKKDQVLAELFVPELDAEYEEKLAQVLRHDVLVRVAEQMVKVATDRLHVAAAQVEQSQADEGKYRSEVDRWQSEVARLTKLVADRVVDRQVLDESTKQWKSTVAALDSAQAATKAAGATRNSRQSDIDKARVDVEAAEADAKIARAEAQRYAALRSYTKITAPYDGVIVVRNVNTGDFVQPVSGDKSIGRALPDTAGAATAPIYVVARTDIVRIFVDVPEMSANNVIAGSDARVRIQALGDIDIDAKVTRTSWSLNVQTRTLRAEIDLPNKDAKLLPGMYANANVFIRRVDTITLPTKCVVELGNHPCCYLLQDGKAVQTPVQTGTSDGEFIEVSHKQVAGQWKPIEATDQIIVGDLSELSNGSVVRLSSSGLKSTTSVPRSSH
jgi:multidrug efflux pump subunit AcrA (membrane-fusion protein)